MEGAELPRRDGRLDPPSRSSSERLSLSESTRRFLSLFGFGFGLDLEEDLEEEADDLTGALS